MTGGSKLNPKERVRSFWEDGACGEAYAQGSDAKDRLEAQSRARYELEPHIDSFARFAEGRGRDVLEIGVGMGADHAEWAKHAPKRLVGVDLTRRAISLTRERFEILALQSSLNVADAERLPFADDSFDIVYSYGVLHHSPNTPAAIAEVRRVLRPGGVARLMIYQRHSLVGYMLWLRYALMVGRPLRSLDEVYATHLESPGTKAYSPSEARRMCLSAGFEDIRIMPQLSVGDLLAGVAGQRHQGKFLEIARFLWPRRIVQATARRFGLFLLIEAR